MSKTEPDATHMMDGVKPEETIVIKGERCFLPAAIGKIAANMAFYNCSDPSEVDAKSRADLEAFCALVEGTDMTPTLRAKAMAEAETNRVLRLAYLQRGSSNEA